MAHGEIICSEVTVTMETVPSDQTQGVVNISYTVVPYHGASLWRQDMVVAFGFLSLVGGPMLHCFLQSCLGFELQSPSSPPQGGIGTSTWRLSSYRPHPVLSKSSAGISGKDQGEGTREPLPEVT